MTSLSTKPRRLGAATALVVALTTWAASTPAAETIGNCELFGQKGQFAMAPARPGRLTVEVHLPAPAWWNGASPDTIHDGFEYCLAANIAHRVGLDRVEVVDIAWPGLPEGGAFWDAVVTGQSLKFDLALSEISITDQRRQVIDFSVPYFSSDIGVIAKGGTDVNTQAIAGLRIGVQRGTTGAGFVEQVLRPTKPPTSFGSMPSMFIALQAGRIDVAMTDTAILLGQAADSGGRFKVVGQYATGETYGAVYPKGSPNAATLDAVIQALIDDGTVKRLAATYLAAVWGIDPATVPYLQP